MNKFKNRSFGIIWLPLLSFWALLFAISHGKYDKTFNTYITLFVYLISSAILSIQAQTTLLDAEQDNIPKINKLNFLFLSILISSIFIIIDTINTLNKPLIISIFIIAPLIITQIIFTLNDYSQEQLSTKFTNRLRERKFLKTNQNLWLEFLFKLKEDFKKNITLTKEIERVEYLIEYSSYFRSIKSAKELENLKQKRDEKIILDHLKKIK